MEKIDIAELMKKNADQIDMICILIQKTNEIIDKINCEDENYVPSPINTTLIERGLNE